MLAGVPFFGMLDKCNLGQEAECAEPCSMEELRRDCARSNALLLEQLHESEYSAELLELTRADAALGRMSMPVPVEDVDLSSIRLAPRFAVVQGEHEDGRPKVRPVDHFSWSAPPEGTTKREGKRKMKQNSVNGRTKMPEKIKYDHVDDLIAMAELLLNELKVVFVATVHECSCGLMRFVCRCCQGFGKLILRQPLEECLFAKGIDGQLSLSSERKGR